jgi:hypothetical protein
VKRKNKETLSADKVSYKSDLKDKKVWYGILLGAVVVGIAMERIWRINKKNNNITDLKQIANHHDISLYKAKEELIILGKKDAPEFTMKFKEAYPELNEKLIQIQPNLVNTEIAFCAYLKLNFTTKEIATFIGVTPRAVQMELLPLGGHKS